MRDDAPGRSARVVSVGRNAAWICFEDEDVVRLAQLRKGLERLALVPGDLVAASRLEDERVIVERREPRTFALERTTAGGRTKTMAANIDGIAIVAALARPVFHLAMIDELIAFAEIHDIVARLILTKADIADDIDVPALVHTYASLGYVTLLANPKEGLGMDAVEATLAGHRTLLIGQSGVGKSSLFGALGGTADVGEVSKIGRGKQTTTTGRLHRFADGFLIDSPGVGEFELHEITPAELTMGFREFAALPGSCRFTDCVHRDEPGCRIAAGVADGAIATTRYRSYRTILDRTTDRGTTG